MLDTSPVEVRFLSTPSARRATDLLRGLRGGTVISIHALREEGDVKDVIDLAVAEHFYPRPPRGGRPSRKWYVFAASGISIHALREEGDRPCCPDFQNSVDFYPRPPRGGRLAEFHRDDGEPPISIHALREEGDGRLLAALSTRDTFLSTPSARRATVIQVGFPIDNKDFYPRPPRGGRLQIVLGFSGRFIISIHALREEGDLIDVVHHQLVIRISIHALREEGDRMPRKRSCPST